MKKNEWSAAKADRDWWRAMGDEVGWTLSGWTHRESATFFDKRSAMVNLTGEQRDDIMAAIERATKTHMTHAKAQEMEATMQLLTEMDAKMTQNVTRLKEVSEILQRWKR